MRMQLLRRVAVLHAVQAPFRPSMCSKCELRCDSMLARDEGAATRSPVESSEPVCFGSQCIHMVTQSSSASGEQVVRLQ